jgi:hypothetical protein
MARGWESKSVESQQADADTVQQSRPQLSPVDRVRLQARRSLELALAHTQAELGAACRAPHRDMLHERLKAIRQAIDALP